MSKLQPSPTQDSTLSWSPTARVFVLGGMALGLVAFLVYLRPLVTPLVVSGLLAYIMNPLVEWLTERSHLRRGLIVSIVYWLGLTLLIVLPILALPTLLTEFETLAQDLQTLVDGIQMALREPVSLLGLSLNLGSLVPDITSLVADGVTSLTANALHLIESTTKNLLWVLVILVATYYLLSDWRQLNDWLLRLPPPAYRPDATRLALEISRVWRGYLRGNLVLMAVVGVVFTIAWLVLGVPGAFVLGFIAGLLTIIPDLGPAIAGVLAAGVALVEGSNHLPLSNFWFAVLVFGVYLGMINVKNIWLRPRVFGRSVHMHEGIVFIAIMVAVVLEGIIGALVVVPLLASAAILVRYLYRRALGQPPWPETPPAE